MSAQHTPGPWTFGKARRYWHVGGPVGVESSCGYICRLPPFAVAEANARLIASAPDLLATLKALRPQLLACHGANGGLTEAARKDAMTMVLTAIAKAEVLS